MKNKTFLFIGGDLRQITAANTLSKTVNVCVYGFDNHVSERFDRSVVALENIDNIAREDRQSYIDYTFDGMQIKTRNINEIELGYGYTYDQETNRYALIPVWLMRIVRRYSLNLKDST